MAEPEPGGPESKGGNGNGKGNANVNANGDKKKKPPNLDLLKKEKVEEPDGGLSPGVAAQKSPKPDSSTKNPRLDPSPKTPRSSERSPKSPRPDVSPSTDHASLLVKGEYDGSSGETPPRSPKPQYPLSDSPKRFPDSPLRADSSKQAQLQERHRERHHHHHHHHHHDSHHSSPSEHHRTLSKQDSTVSHRKHSTDSDEEGHHHHHHHHRSPKRTMSERRRHSQRASSTSHSGADGTENRSEHRRTSSVGGSSSRRHSMRASDRRKSSFHDPHGGIVVGTRRISVDRMSHERMSISEGGTMNGSPVHIEYYKKPSHPTGPYMSPYLSSAYKTPAAEVLIASLIIIVGLVALITSWATGIKVWLVVGGVCVGLGGMFMLLGLCWYCALARQKQENEDLELKVLNSKQLLKLARTPSNASQNAPQMV